MSPNPKRRTVADRFWSKVSGGDFTTCWTWTGAIQSGGYGAFVIQGRKQISAHRFAYEFMRDEIPSGLQIDHLCRTRRCVNPWHLEPVTARVNLLRSEGAAAVNARLDACRRGHAFTDDNTLHLNGRRHCRACNRIRTRAYTARKQAGGAA